MCAHAHTQSTRMLEFIMILQVTIYRRHYVVWQIQLKQSYAVLFLSHDKISPCSQHSL
jgi:hypothetical protein